MGDEIFPAATPWMEPYLRNYVDNPIVVQFVHRWMAFVAAAAIGVVAWQAWRRRHRLAASMLAAAVVIQIGLGSRRHSDGRRTVGRRGAPGNGRFAARRLAAGRPPTWRAGRLSAIVTVYATFADRDEASRIARAVVDERLAACANILAPCTSIYRWQGATEEAQEVPCLVQDARRAGGAADRRIAALHSYEVPAAVVWPIADALPAYGEWVAGETSS
jgi:periplasmic divalent cation tolerance protein